MQHKMTDALSDKEYARLAEIENDMYEAALNYLLDTIDFDEYDYMSEEEKEKYCKLQNSIGRIDFCACGKHIEGAKEIVVTSEQQSVTKK